MTAEEAQEYMLSAKYAEAVRTELYRLLNEHRVANGLKELKVNADLQGYADIHAEEQRISFGHTRPDGSSAGSGWYNSKNVMNSPRYAENALKTGALNSDLIDTALGIFTIWKESAGHNRHMLYKFDSCVTILVSQWLSKLPQNLMITDLSHRALSSLPGINRKKRE